MTYDLSSQPHSIGDILVFQEASLVLKEEFDLEIIDFVFINYLTFLRHSH